MKFSVLICTYNHPYVLREALAALIDRTTEKPNEVIVVNGGDERTDVVVQEFSVVGLRSSVSVLLLKTVNKNLAASRNVGLPHCTGEIIAMTDDDAQVFPDWVTQMKRVHREHPEAGAVGGTVIALDRSHLASRLAERVTFPSSLEPGYRRTLPTVNLSYKSQVIQRVGAQDENLWTGEDVDYNWRMIKLGYQVYFDPAIRVYHNHPRAVRDLWRKHYLYGRGYYMLRSKWRDLYCIYPHQLRSLKDFLKLGNFFAFPFYEPFIVAAKMKQWRDKIITLPVEFLNQMSARYGLTEEFLRRKFNVSAR